MSGLLGLLIFWGVVRRWRRLILGKKGKIMLEGSERQGLSCP